MSSPRSIGGSGREGTRVVLREITASLHNSPPMQPSRRKSGTDNSASKSAEHEVKVRFAREFADVGSITYSAPESLSSASSFQSLSSTLSTKSSSGICPDSVPPSPLSQALNTSYANTNISGLEDLIIGCSEINLNSDTDRSYDTLQNSQDLSQDQTFASATDEPIEDLVKDLPKDLTSEISLTESQNVSETVENNSTKNESSCSLINRTQDIQERPILRTICTASNRRNSFIKLESLERPISPNKTNESSVTDFETDKGNFVNGIEDVLLPESCTTEDCPLNTTVSLSPSKDESLQASKEEPDVSENNSTNEAQSLSLSFVPSSAVNSVSNSELGFAEYAEEPSLPSIPTLSSLLISTDSAKLSESDAREDKNDEKSLLERSSTPINNSNAAVTSFPLILAICPALEAQDKNDSLLSPAPEAQNKSEGLLIPASEVQNKSCDNLSSVVPEVQNKSCNNLSSPAPEAQNKTYDSSLSPAPEAQTKGSDNLSSPAAEAQNTSDTQIDSVSPSLPNNVTNDEQIPVNEALVARSKTPEVEGKPAINICQQVESNNIVATDFHEISPSKEDSLEANASPFKKEETEATSKPDESRDEKIAEDSKTDVISSIGENKNESLEEQTSDDQLDTTITLEDDSVNLEIAPEVEQYTEFKPQRQSTTLPTVNVEQQPNLEEQYTAFKPQRQSTALTTLNIEPPNFEVLKSAAEQVANDIFNSSLEFSEEPDCFISATSEIFQDPKSFDFLINHGNSKTINRLRAESLYVKFDPLVGDTSMLPQGNNQPINEEQNGKNENVPVTIDTPKRNPAIAAIDRLLFYSPISTSMTQKMDEPQEKVASKEPPVEEPKSNSPLITDVNMSKELELVRATVLQLEEELEKQKKEYEAELEKQKNAYQEKINKLQAQMAQEVKSKSQMTVVVEEYEKSISRLLTERERDRTNFEQEKAKLQEELQTTNVHLANTEAAFNDVHQKYERLKGVVTAHKSNEALLKESIQENMETIKGLEARYDQLKTHAMSQLEKANYELDAMRKQHEDETVKLHAMVRKAELKSNSLAELVEQKTKENKELTQILDEVIARVGHQNAE